MGANAGGAGTGSAGGGSGSGTPGGSAGTGDAADPALVARGEYLTAALGCGFCHMPLGPNGPDFSRKFAGGLEVPDAFGTWRAPNITQDQKTGIGSWTDDQIAAAIREGVRPDGQHLYPIMPYLNYNRMTDADAKALVAFLRTVPAVENEVKRSDELKLPKIPAPKPANAPDATDDPMKHGEYLVTLMHCNMCHATPDATGMPDFMGKPFSGGQPFELAFMGTGTLYSANITSDEETGIGKWSKEQIASAIKTLTRPDGTVIQGPMQFYLGGWSKLEAKDLDAIATYVKAIPPMKNKVPASTFKPNPPPGAGAGGTAPGGAGSGSAAP